MQGWPRFVLTVGALGAAGQAWAQGTTTPGVPSDFGWKDGVTLAIAVLGAGLGVLNYWNTVSARRVRLRIKPSVAYSIDNMLQDPMIGIEVINLSTFAVTVTEVGFTLAGTTARAVAARPVIIDGKPWPRRLESREAVTAYMEQPTRGQYMVPSVYARLASGEHLTGKGPALNGLRA